MYLTTFARTGGEDGQRRAKDTIDACVATLVRPYALNSLLFNAKSGLCPDRVVNAPQTVDSNGKFLPICIILLGSHKFCCRRPLFVVQSIGTLWNLGRLQSYYVSIIVPYELLIFYESVLLLAVPYHTFIIDIMGLRLNKKSWEPQC